MLIAPGIATLNISAPVLGSIDAVHLTLLWDEQSVILVDTGFPRQLAQLKEETERYGALFDRIDTILMTHQDIDHIGNLPELLKGSATKIEVYAHEVEKPYIEGEKRILKFTDEAIASIDKLPAQVPEEFKQGPSPESTLDRKAAILSLQGLSAFDIETVICYHGGVYQKECNRRIAELAKA